MTGAVPPLPLYAFMAGNEKLSTLPTPYKILQVEFFQDISLPKFVLKLCFECAKPIVIYYIPTTLTIAYGPNKFLCSSL
jgi:hypothetical protein